MEEIKMTYDKITIELTNYKKEFWNLMMKGTKGNSKQNTTKTRNETQRKFKTKYNENSK